MSVGYLSEDFQWAVGKSSREVGNGIWKPTPRAWPKSFRKRVSGNGKKEEGD